MVVPQDKAETAANVATVIDLADRRAARPRRLRSPTTTGGTWALGDGDLCYPTIGDGRAYCLARSTWPTRTARTAGAPRRARASTTSTAASTASGMMTFDDPRPPCRTVALVDGSGYPAVEGARSATAGTARCSTTEPSGRWCRKTSRIEAAHFYAPVGGGYFDLGPGTSGSLTLVRRRRRTSSATRSATATRRG